MAMGFFEMMALAILALAFLGLNFYRRDWGVAIFVAVLPVYLVRYYLNLPGLPELPTTFLEGLFLALFLPWLFERGFKAEAWRGLRRWQQPLTLIVVGSVLGVLTAADRWGAVGLWRAYFLEPLLFLAVFTDTVVAARDRRRVLIGLGACLAFIGLVAGFQKITGWNIPNPIWQDFATRRVTFFYGFPNAIGLFAAPVTVLMGAWAVALFQSGGTRRWWSIAAAAAALLGLSAAWFAVSKGALIGMAAGLLLFGLTQKKLRPWAVGAVIIGCLAVMLYRPLTNRASGIFDGSDPSSSVRLIVWDESLDLLRHRPVFGGGLGGYPIAMVPYHRADHIEIFQYPHTLLMNFWTEIGIIGLAGFIWLFITFFWQTAGLLKHRYGWLPLALLGAMTAVLVHGLVDVPYFKNDLAFLFWILVGLSESLLLQAEHRPTIREQVRHALHLDDSGPA